MSPVAQTSSGSSERTAPAAPDFTAADFPVEPAAQCDVVMKGGITSGVLYPLAVCELATKFRLRSVGGASAGAIAASAAAAAEVGRRSVLSHGLADGPAVSAGDVANGPEGLKEPEGSNETGAATEQVPDPVGPSGPVAKRSSDSIAPGYLGYSQFPERLAAEQDDGRSLLFHLFRPQPEARRLFGLLSAILEQQTKLREKLAKAKPAGQEPKATTGQQVAVVFGVLLHAIKAAPVRAFLCAAPGLILLVLAVAALIQLPSRLMLDLPTGDLALVDLPALGWVRAALIVAMVVGLAAAVVGMLIGLLVGVLRDVARLPQVGFGMSSGRGRNDDETALTPWLYERLQDLAGRGYEQPLTFGDLAADELKLQMMTTNLSRSQPMVMPWSTTEYFFDRIEFEKLFGPVITKAMADNPPPLPDGAIERRLREVLLRQAATENKLPFPAAAQLPIIVATRMSLSFPLLISAVPLYAYEPSGHNQAYEAELRQRLGQLPESATAAEVLLNAPAELRPELSLNWFSDGGLTANLPVQFFDAVLPTRPTFAINLAPFDADHPHHPDDERANSSLPTDNTTGPGQRTAQQWPTSSMAALVSFGAALINTARNWVDESSLMMPGYRDRVVTVYQSGAEGGINLAMPPDLVKSLGQRGRFAASRLVDRFGPDQEGFPNHRWVRFRVATAALSDWLAAFERGYIAKPTLAELRPDDADFYDKLLKPDAEQPSYEISEADRVVVRARVAGLRAEIAKWARDPADVFTADRPQVPPILRLVPRTDADD